MKIFFRLFCICFCFSLNCCRVSVFYWIFVNSLPLFTSIWLKFLRFKWLYEEGEIKVIKTKTIFIKKKKNKTLAKIQIKIKNIQTKNFLFIQWPIDTRTLAILIFISMKCCSFSSFSDYQNVYTFSKSYCD